MGHVSPTANERQAQKTGAYPLAAFVVHVCVPITCGAAIYLGWRSQRLLIHWGLRAAGLGGLLSEMRTIAGHFNLPGVVRFSVPHGLWSYALVAHFGRLWRGTPSARRWAAGAAAAACFSELGQLCGLVPGTFDLVDLMTVALACVLAWIFTFPPRRTSLWNVRAAS